MYTIYDRVSYSRIDRDGLMGISNVVDCLQDCCMFHSEDAGHSALELLKKDPDLFGSGAPVPPEWY